MTNTADREISTTRLLDAPCELVWKAWTDPAHIAQWWGPDGFTNTIHKMEVRPGGEWTFIMHGPDGTDYDNKIEYIEVVRPERLVYRHGEQGRPDYFLVTTTFTRQGDKARLDMQMLFETAKDRDLVVEKYGAIEGQKQTLGRLEIHLAKMKGDFVISRTFDAPRQLVWKAWTEEKHLKNWFGPKGVTISVSEMDLRPGGSFHYCMKLPDGKEMWGKWFFREIVAPERLVMINCFSDAKGGITRHPMSATWPLETFSTTTFTEHDCKTTLTLRWSAYNATEEERHTFDTSHASMTQGWTGTMDQLENYLATFSTD
ncbi:MAG: SRPBCC family protein [Gallionella sp.]